MYSRIITKPLESERSFFLFGPRGTGKTTWLKAKFPDSLHLDLLDSGLYTDLTADPSYLRTLIPPGYGKWIIIDEVQRIPALLNEVHRLIENKQYKFILTGSSARSLRKKGTNLLGGRAFTYHMYPLTAVELGKDFSLETSLRYGHLPSVYANIDREKYLRSYVQTYLREEVLQEGLTRNLGAFTRFLETASFSQGSLLNVSEVAREAGLERKTVANYFSIHEDLLIASFLPVFTRRTKRRLVSHNKFYYFDSGVFNTIRPKGPLDSTKEIGGNALETIVLQELKAVNEYYDYRYSIYFWRTSNGTEVDFILYGENGLIAMEVKSKEKITGKDLRGLQAFQTDYPEASLFLLHTGARREYHGAVSVLPVGEALKEFPSILALS